MLVINQVEITLFSKTTSSLRLLMMEKQNDFVLTMATPMTTSTKSPRRSQHLKEILFTIVTLALFGQFFYAIANNHTALFHGSVEYTANSTLGFGSIYAVSRKGSARRDPLLRAAALTDIDITIPHQPQWSDSDLERIKSPENSNLQFGSALAWLGHLHALETFLNSSAETALILEDDVDWDTRLRTQQIPRTAHAIRELLNSPDGAYYGSTNAWDIIWLGHCGDFFDASRGAELPAIKSFTDSAMPAFEDLHPWTQDFMTEIGAIDNQQRLVHQSVGPLCSFAYAITRPAAERIVHELGIRESLPSQEKSCPAYDVRLLELCRDEGFKCITVNPELFHHCKGESEIATVEETLSGKQPFRQARETSAGSSTPNVRCSARSEKWWDLRSEIAESALDPHKVVREMATTVEGCIIDDL